jgi:hypothetical protein
LIELIKGGMIENLFAKGFGFCEVSDVSKESNNSS